MEVCRGEELKNLHLTSSTMVVIQENTNFFQERINICCGGNP